MGTLNRGNGLREPTYQAGQNYGRENMLTESAIKKQVIAKQAHYIRAAEIDTAHSLAALRIPPELAKRPTTARPGSYRKSIILAARYQYGFPINHQHDQEGAVWSDERKIKYGNA